MFAKCAIISIVASIYTHGVLGVFYKTNVTDYNNCKIYYTRFESGYKTFFKLPESEDPELLVDFHFSVLAVSDAHILLATSSRIKASDPAYEIVIGAGGNTFSDIRRKQKGNVRVSYRMKGLLSAVDVTSFWIHIHKNGLIAVGKEGEQVGFMTWKDPEVLRVKVFTFAGWGNIEAKWFYDCPRVNENADIKNRRPPTEYDRLRQYILNLNESHNDMVEVNVQLTSQFVSLDEKGAILNVKGRANFSWTFLPIKWNPANFSGLHQVQMQHSEIWRPELVITNAIDVEHLQPFVGNTLIANHDGQIIWQPSFDISTYCSLDGIENWPNDIHECDIYLATTWAQNNFVQFVVKFPSETIQLTGNEFDSEWHTDESVKIHSYRMSSGDSPDVYIKMPNSLALRLKIKRRASLYGTAFNAPLLLVATMMLVNFWCSPFDYIKVSIISAQFIITTMASIGLAVVLPAHREIIPIIVYRYSAAMIANTLNLIISVIVINLARNKQLFEPSHAIAHIVKSKLVEKLLFLPELTPQLTSPYPAAMATSRRRSRVQDVWIRLGMCVDRIAFIIYLTFLVSVFLTKYNPRQ